MSKIWHCTAGVNDKQQQYNIETNARKSARRWALDYEHNAQWFHGMEILTYRKLIRRVSI